MVKWRLMSAHTQDPWKHRLQPGQILRFPDNRVWVVQYVNVSRAYVYPLTPEERTINVPSKADHRKKVIKEINDYGEPTNIAAGTFLPLVELCDLTETEYRRLQQLISQGVDIPLE